MNNKLAIVVGGTGGVGHLVTVMLAAAGCDIALVYRTADRKAQELQQKIEAAGRKCRLIKADVSDPEAVNRLVTETLDEFGRIDVLVNTQGWTHEMKLLQEASLEDMQRTLEVELWSVIQVCRAVVPHMIAQQGGRIVTIGSDAGKVGATGEAVSSAARGGVIAFSRGLAREVARHGIAVNVVCPGPIATELFENSVEHDALTAKLAQSMVRATPMKRLAHPDEVADLVCYLALGRGAAFITGQAISINGGLSMA